ncbi:MAG: 3-deoxy-D-manno-octulosonic acid transferase [Syntrophaceae bacterium]|nr:3-deoxy-D-manno-octulosonic acid transferase [Syntrophaceae bacterium]
MFFLYNLLMFVVGLFAIPYYAVKMWTTGKYRKSLTRKFGYVEPRFFGELQGSPRIWIHAVSVGEVTAAAPIVASLREHYPGACLVFSTGTETGQDMARRMVKDASAFLYYPLDIPWVVRKMLDGVRPDVYIMVETELWPNFLRICRERGIRTLMVNGRLSPRSFRGYRLSRFFWKPLLDAVADVGVISATDARRLVELGLPKERVHVLGNAKYDGLAANASPVLHRETVRKLNLNGSEKVLVAGSTHEGEETVVLETYRRLLMDHPDFTLILVPRHIERAQAVLSMVRAAGFEDVITFSEIQAGRSRQAERIVLVDVIGELFKLYSVATIVFCGGSLVPKGGQNILEPAAWGKVVFYGPSMDDFLEERKLLEETGAGVTVRSGDELLKGISGLLAHPEDMARRGGRGRDAVIANMGAAERYAAMIRIQLEKK